MKFVMAILTLMLAMNVMACDGSGKDKPKNPEDERISTIK